ncbi:PDZ domain-containing protein [Clostridiaceae bacterium]|nr:PDZ domain-containing protein [Clostridiaceae bacterium]RKI13832.1 PDZ domain-containing protein [bacterium 1XD21-70]
MPGVQDPKKEPGKRRFITEKIVRRPLTRGELFRRGLFLLLAAALFGGVAGVSFAVSQPLVARHMKQQETEPPKISIPKDEPLEAAAEKEPVAETEAEAETPPAPEGEPVEKVVRNAMENYRYTVGDLNELLFSLRSQVQAVSKGVVTLHSVQQDVDWFDNPVETTGLYAGVVIASTEQEFLILTPEAAVEHADSIKVMFADGVEVNGRIKQQDTISGMAVVSVDVSEMGEGTLKEAKPLVLGNSYLVREGDLVVAVGSPAGMARSIDYGFVSYIGKNVQMVDQVTRVFYSRISADAGRGTFLVNTSGELIGWVMPPKPDEEDGNMAKAMGISDYKGILENLTNGLAAPCFGIEGQEVSETMASQGLPNGIYVLNSVTERPAYDAGIQNGDIITHIDGREITTMKDFQNTVDNLECGRLVNVIVQRNGRDQYAKLEFQVTVGAR